MGTLELWHKVEKTDPAHVKPITGKSYQGTSPKPYYLIQKATEVFGPCGIGWGFSVVDERIEDAGTDRISIARVRVWYEWNGKRGEVEHVGGTTFSGVRSSGKAFSDEDAPKKSVTDALIKALSLIGFAGDIFMGRYDDSKYVNNLREEIQSESQHAPSPRAAGGSQPRANSGDDPFTDEAACQSTRARLIEQWRKRIANEADVAALGAWWNGDQRKKECHDFGLTAVEILDIKNAVVARKAFLEERAAA